MHARELNEELGIQIQSPQFLTEHPYEYALDNKKVILHFSLVKHFSGAPYGKENQPVKWIELTEIKQHTFPKGNDVLIAHLLNF